LSALLDRVRHGKTIVIVDRGRPVARLEPALDTARRDPAGRLARLERAGLVKRATRRSPDRLLRRQPPRPKAGASLLEALLDERREGR
jgi:antitoxin (DNA-binding transcriptional repressor) of toxin-antitoxin stability system